MMGFFKVTDVPSRRVVQYARVSGSGENVVFIEDESVLGAPVDDMPFADKTGIAQRQVCFMRFRIWRTLATCISLCNRKTPN